MARFTTTLDVPTRPRVAFDAIADFTRTVEWDDSIVSARRLDEDAIGLGSRFEVDLSLGPRTAALIYEITTYVPPTDDTAGHLVLTTQGRLHRGADDVLLHPTADGCRVEWRARFALRGPGLLLDPVLGVGFRRTATKAVAGLERFLVAEATDRDG